MRKVRLLLLVCILFVCGVGLITVNATTIGLQTYSLPEEEKTEFIEGLDIERLDNDDQKSAILSFDVRDDGTVAIAIGGGIIYVYDQSGEFQYGFRIDSNGDFGIEFQNEMLAIVFIRGEFVALFDSTAECVDVQRASNLNQHLPRILEILDRTVKEVAGKSYVLERDIEVGAGYSRFVKIDEHGERTVLYDVTTNHKISQVLLIVSIIGVFSFGIWGCIKKLEENE